jgi:hypothetical protein
MPYRDRSLEVAGRHNPEVTPLVEQELAIADGSGREREEGMS